MSVLLTRREFLTASAVGLAIPRFNDAQINLKISQITLDLGPGRSIKTIGYNGHVPGPLLRVTEGDRIVLDVANDTDSDELVHWHGFHIPSDVDGSHEEGTPHVPRRGSRRYEFTARPAGTRWYHSHVHSGKNFQTGTYSGQYGMIVVESRSNPGKYDQDVPVLLHEWDPHLTSQGAVDVDYGLFSMNGKMLGSGEPIRVRQGQRVLFRILNASATMTHRVAMAGHTFEVIAMDGTAIPAPRRVPILEMGPGERIDAIVEMNEPGKWILGETRDDQRERGMGIVVEYAGATGAPLWSVQPSFAWDYCVFGNGPVQREASIKIPLVFRARGDYQWTINGKSYPKTDPIRVRAGQRYRMLFDNQSAHAHPVHLHRHTFELVDVAGRATSGLYKDVVIVPAWKTVEVEVEANNPGPTLFHCHQQFHMDYGFMAMMEYEAFP